jgi:hypothetical protein
VAACRLVWDDLSELSREAILLVERAADLHWPQDEPRLVGMAKRVMTNWDQAINYEWSPGRACELDAGQVQSNLMSGNGDSYVEEEKLLQIFDDIFGASPLTSEGWTPDPVSLAIAHRIYWEKDFTSESMGVLGDALEDEGAPEELLSHVRSPGPHVRGCWAIDHIMGLQ